MRVVSAVSSIFATIALFAAPMTAHAIPGDELWSKRWSRPGADQAVNATLEFNGQLVIGGDFNFVGSVPAARVAIYNGTQWTALGAGFDGEVTALAVYGNELYAGGAFTASGATPLAGLARWNGAQWVAVGGGVNGRVETLESYGGALVVGGSFSVAGGSTPVGSLAAWNGSTWNTLDGGVDSPDGAVLDAEVFAGSLYITGRFENAGPINAANIARWDGFTWSALGSGLTDQFGDPIEGLGVRLHVWSGRVVVTGTFTHADGVARANFATWNGTAWGSLGADPNFFSSGAGAMGDFAGSLLVDQGVSGYVHRWTGSSWSLFATAPFAYTMGHLGTDLVMGGTFTDVNGTQAEKLARFNGTSWSAMATGDGASPGVGSFFEWNGNLVAGASGFGARFGGVSGSMIASWNGTQWAGFGLGIPGGFQRHVSGLAAYAGGLVAGGFFPQAGGVSVTDAALWNGSTWSAMGTTTASIQDLKVIRGALYAAGQAGASSAVTRWNGSAWVSIGNIDDIAWDVDEYRGKLVAAGNFNTIGGTAIRGLATWDSLSGTWSAIGSSALNGGVNAIVVDADTLYIAGLFTSVGGVPANRVAKWNGTSWAALGAGVSARVLDMIRFNGNLFVTGDFTQAGGQPANFIARWDGAKWNAMGSGLNARGLGLGVHGNALFVGGDFTQAGGTAAHGISSWSAPASSGVEPGPTGARQLALRAAPTPFSRSTAISWTLAERTHVRVTVYDLSGRRLATLLNRSLEAGPHSAPWDGNDDAGHRVAPGVYLSRVEAGSWDETLRIVRVE